MEIHNLKTDPAVFDAIIDRRKNFEIRLNDRNFEVGDGLVLQKTKATGEEMKQGAPLVFTGDECFRHVDYILKGPIYGLQEGWVIMSID